MLSIIIPIHNEEDNLSNLKKLDSYLKGKYEILACDNASTDNTKKIIKNYTSKTIKYLYTPKKGIGAGIKLGIKNAKYQVLMFYAIDLPFGLKIINDSLNQIKNHDVVIGSKAHKKSINNHPLKRKIFSFAYNSLINLFFNLKVKDSQGSLMFKKKHANKYLKHLLSDNSFLETQILIFSKKLNLSIKEIPVKYKEQRKTSKINPFKEGYMMLKQLLKEKQRVKKIEMG